MKRIIETRWKFSNVFLIIDRSYHFFNSLKKLIEQYFKNEEVKRIIKVVTHRVMHSTSDRKFIIHIIVNDIILALNSNLFVLSNEMILRVRNFSWEKINLSKWTNRCFFRFQSIRYYYHSQIIRYHLMIYSKRQHFHSKHITWNRLTMYLNFH
jgi:hypothetical protein